MHQLGSISHLTFVAPHAHQVGALASFGLTVLYFFQEKIVSVLVG